ncbi:MAG: hypothetical protein FD169_2475 [Bacillota bacterium]|nr:MAG: hypothetical protein FD169_2475 [Bacillota bacterium]
MQELLNRARRVADQAEVYKSQTKQESVSFQASPLGFGLIITCWHSSYLSVRGCFFVAKDDGHER